MKSYREDHGKNHYYFGDALEQDVALMSEALGEFKAKFARQVRTRGYVSPI